MHSVPTMPVHSLSPTFCLQVDDKDIVSSEASL